MYFRNSASSPLLFFFDLDLRAIDHRELGVDEWNFARLSKRISSMPPRVWTCFMKSSAVSDRYHNYTHINLLYLEH